MCAKIATLFNDLAFLGCDDVTKLNQRPKTLHGVDCDTKIINMIKENQKFIELYGTI